ncbi:hypothetical protein ACIF6H_32560 [Streptomyces microflavus]|uniref:hypothetical protein n=1 Tax=Streptomyces microflavus TaxID=1919 RepID=UPI0037D31CF8
MPSTQEIIDRMHKLQEERNSAFAPLASVMSQREDVEREIAELRKRLEQRLAELDVPYKAAFNGAVAGGWSVAELEALGAPEPPRPVKRGRPKRSRSTTPKKDAESTSPVAAPSEAGAEIPAQLDTEGGKPKVEEPASL